MAKIAIIGAGISGMTTAHLLRNNNQVTIFEKESTPGGLIRCRRVNGGLYHICGGHVFNSKRQDVLDWFWSKFNKNEEFIKTKRNSVVFMNNGLHVPYPIENHMFLFDETTQKSFINDLITMAKEEDYIPTNFEEFLRHRFGETLYNLYFKPYNEKVWRRNLCHVPLSWLEGKLPIPTVSEIIFNNINHVEEKQFVHSSFWYEKNNGSQYIADKLSAGLDIRYNSDINIIIYDGIHWNVAGESFDKIIFCGNIKDMVKMIKGVDISNYMKPIEDLEFHGTTSVFCSIDKNPYSWIYQPSTSHDSHRIICTGNFAESNNTHGTMTGTIEFTDYISKEDILDNLNRMPLHPHYLDHHYNQYTYPIQVEDTRKMIKKLKNILSERHFYFTGRFADWEYYNMDVAMGAAMDMCKNYKL